MTAKPPVFYFLMQVRFNRITQMRQHVSAFQEVLRQDGFADFNEEFQLEVAWQQGGNAQPSIQEARRERWIFSDMDRRSGFVLLDDALVFHTTAYTRFSDCKAAMLKALKQLDVEVDLNFVQRIGIRYLDQITAQDLSSLGQWVHPGLLGLAGDMAGNLRYAYSESVSLIDGFTLVLKSTQSPAGLVMPADMQDIALTLPDEVTGNRQPQVVMDSDCYVEKRFPFDLGVIEDQLGHLHDKLLGLFKSSLTEKARKLWQL